MSSQAKNRDDVYVSAPLTPNDVATATNDAATSKKLSRAERYALEPPFRERENPLDTASLFSIISTHWLQPLVSLGATKVLEQQDLWRVCRSDSCDVLEVRFQQHYDNPATGVALALFKTFFREAAIMFVNYSVYLLAMVLQPFLSMAILDFLNDRENVFHISNGYVLVVLMGVVSFTGVTCLNYGVFVLSRSGANMRSVVMNAVYQKALRLSSSARQKYTTGEIMTLMSVDTERIFHASIAGPWIFFAPLAFVITIALIAGFFDVIAAISGAALLVAVLTTSIKLAARIGRTQSALLKIVEERVKVTSEALQGIRVMKFYAWEESLARRVEAIRAREVQMYRKFHFLSIANSAMLFLTPVLLGAVTLGIFLARKGTMTVTEAFTLIAMVNISRLGVSMFPNAIASVSQARIAFQRLDKYMASEELVVDCIESEPVENEGERSRGRIVARNASFLWSSTASESPAVVIDGEATSESHGFQLEGVNIEIESGSLVMVVGTVGAGKSSLLHALLGEMRRTSGTCVVDGEVAYVSQEAWIRNSTVKDNILFESPLDSERYERVLEATQLALDLHALPDGDQTEIGERGINLSGGQKARVAIARAMYRRDYDILMLDDPLSAVDPHVAHAIFHQCIADLARTKTRVLVLNSHYDLLAYADKILVVDHGKIVGDGVYKDMIAQFPSLDIHRQELDAQEKDAIDEHSVEEKTAKTPVAQTVEDGGHSPAAEDKQPKKSDGKLVQDEDRVKGKVSANTYRSYFDETGFNGIAVVVGVVTIYAAAQSMRISADYWQGYWAKQMPRKTANDPTYSDAFYAWWYVGFIITCTVLTFTRGLVLIDMCMRTARNLHDGLFRRVLKAPVNRYFDVTPVGRILNRFANDLDQVDASLPQQYQGMFESLAAFFGSLIVCTFASVYIAVSYVPMLGVFVLTGLYFKRSSREIKRLEGITRTPIFSLFGETLQGLATIRAFKMQQQFIVKNKQAVDQNASSYFHFWAAGRWLAVRLDWLSALVILVVSLYIVSAKGTIAPVIAGLSITYSLTLTSMVQWCVRSVDMTDNAMTSVERLLAFRDIPQEDDEGAQSINTEAWPSHGAIHFDQLCLRYRPELPLVLRGVEMKIEGGEKVGICGRTGAGKSSLMIALFRICEFHSGTVRIDGVDISTLSLRDLRSALAIIPQDPVLYSGSLRENLDPFHQYTDDAIWRVLRQVHLADAVVSWGTSGLDFVVSERGDNLSVGQRQLLCIGRALLKDSQIVVLDEATANVDSATDALIQTTIRETFVSKTVLIIAHRIHTILHCHKIAVMDAGKVAEFGAPSELLGDADSIFAALANRSAAVQEEQEEA